MPFERKLRVAFVAGLSDKKLGQKLEPLLACPRVGALELFRRVPYPTRPRLRTFGVGWAGRRFPLLGDALRFAQLVWRARHCDVIVGCFQLYHGVMAHIVGRLWGKPVIQLVITDVDWNMARPLAGRVMFGADACGTRGPASNEKLRHLKFSGPLAVIHNPIMISPDVLPARSLGVLHDVLAVGDFAPEKNYHLLIQTLRQVKEQLGAVRAMICGKGFPGPLSEALEQAGLTGAVCFPGHLGPEALEEAYRSARMLVLSSRVEGLPMVAVEAMTAGLPVVATNVGELSWLVRDGLEGRLVPAGDATALADAVAGLLENPEKLAKMGKNARKRIQELAPEFSVAAIAGAWTRLFDELELSFKKY